MRPTGKVFIVIHAESQTIVALDPSLIHLYGVLSDEGHPPAISRERAYAKLRAEIDIPCGKDEDYYITSRNMQSWYGFMVPETETETLSLAIIEE